MARASTNAGAAWPRLGKLLRVLVAGGAALSGTCATAPKNASDAEKKEPSQTAKPAEKQPQPPSGGGVQGW